MHSSILKSSTLVYRNFLKDLLPDNANPEKVRLHYLFVVCVIKMRLVARYEAAKEHGIPFDDATTMLGYTSLDHVLSAQRAQIDKLMDQIDANNPFPSGHSRAKLCWVYRWKLG